MSKHRSVSELDIYRAANLLMKWYGEEAAIEAAIRADARFAKGDFAGQKVWLKVLEAMDERKRGKWRLSESVH